MTKAKKNFIKVSLIVIAVLGAVSGIIFWQKKLAEPPQSVTHNQYLSNLRSVNSKLETTDTASLSQQYQLQLERIQLLQEKGLISSDSADISLDAVLTQYVNSLFTWCDGKFGESVWKDRDLKYMHKKTGEPLVKDHEKMKRVRAVLDGRAEVLKLPHQKIESYRDCTDNLAKAKKYKGTDYVSVCLRQCDQTRKILEGLKETYHKKHRAYINSLLNTLDYENNQYPLSKMKWWGETYTAVVGKKDDYFDNWHENKSEYRSKLSQYYRDAQKGFQSQLKKLWWDNDYQYDDYYVIYNSIFN